MENVEFTLDENNNWTPESQCDWEIICNRILSTIGIDNPNVILTYQNSMTSLLGSYILTHHTVQLKSNNHQGILTCSYIGSKSGTRFGLFKVTLQFDSRIEFIYSEDNYLDWNRIVNSLDPIATWNELIKNN